MCDWASAEVDEEYVVCLHGSQLILDVQSCGVGQCVLTGGEAISYQPHEPDCPVPATQVLPEALWYKLSTISLVKSGV